MLVRLRNRESRISTIVDQNVSQARPLEALFCRTIYENGWKDQNEQQLRLGIFRKILEPLRTKGTRISEITKNSYHIQ